MVATVKSNFVYLFENNSPKVGTGNSARLPVSGRNCERLGAERAAPQYARLAGHRAIKREDESQQHARARQRRQGGRHRSDSCLLGVGLTRGEGMFGCK